MRQFFALAALVFVALLAMSAFAPMSRSVDQAGAAPAGPQHPGNVGPGSAQTQYVVVGRPTITVSRINSILAAYGSPAASKGQALYDLGVRYRINPVVALAFFLHESRMGTQGEAVKTRSPGNLRCIASAACVDQDRGGYAAFPTWEAGFTAWYVLISGPLYVGAGLTTFERIIPRYAPSADRNNEAVYVAALKHAVGAWERGEVLV